MFFQPAAKPARQIALVQIGPALEQNGAQTRHKQQHLARRINPSGKTGLPSGRERHKTVKQSEDCGGLRLKLYGARRRMQVAYREDPDTPVKDVRERPG
jgi:hypothetical protein